MGIADNEKSAKGGPFEIKAQKTRQRVFLKRRSEQLPNSHMQSNWTLCTDLQRQWNRRRLRRLFAADKPKVVRGYPCAHVHRSGPMGSFLRYFLLPIFLVLGIICCITLYQTEVTMFVQHYFRQYQAIVHDKPNYCDRSRSMRNIFDNIHRDVINQDAALQQLEEALTNHAAFHSIALVGTSGLGKSLTMQLLFYQYPWKLNVQRIAWNDFDLIEEEARYKKVLGILHNLAHCGRNLLIIDNMSVWDLEYVAIINALALAQRDVANVEISDLDLKQLTIIYVFNVNARKLPDVYYRKRLEVILQLADMTVITYRSFDRSDLERCVRHEARVIDLHLEERYVKEIVSTSNVHISGCKTVRAKVLVYGKPM
ncbi:uncharacterized protein LOC6564726 [Drosophila grimshawi]|uniref:GH12792 n=1 Tax=Drosophila grimshawi TaxID=7222 RepID=B4JL59_DROGR|nr:uncharacterized protein LOC6564726 [Drosophila grimshawi]EDW00312.1 GH12792 [Drosophila grimshawi]